MQRHLVARCTMVGPARAAVPGRAQGLKRSAHAPLAWMFVFALATLVVTGGTVSAADEGSLQLPSFTADRIQTTGGKTKTMKVHGTANAIRLEGEDKGKRSIVIMRFDQKVMWSLIPDQKMYVELPWANQNEWASYLQGVEAQRQPLGEEQVGAYHCEKSRVQVTLQGKAYTSLEWKARELNGFVVKTQDEKGHWSNKYQNVQLGPQDPALFEVPEDYQKLSLGGVFRQR